MREANGWVASTTAPMRSLARNAAKPSAPPKPPMRWGIGAGAGLAVAPASDRIAATSGSSAIRRASALASDVPPRMSRRRRFSGRLHEQGTLARLVGIGEDGIDGLTPAARRLIAQAEFVVGGKRHLALAGSLKAETMTLAVADRERARRHRSAPRPLRMRARQRRSVLLRRRRHADAPFPGRRNDLDPGALRLCARGVAARLEPAGLRVAHASRAPARSDHSAFAARRAHSGALVG